MEDEGEERKTEMARLRRLDGRRAKRRTRREREREGSRRWFEHALRLDLDVLEAWFSSVLFGVFELESLLHSVGWLRESWICFTAFVGLCIRLRVSCMSALDWSDAMMSLLIILFGLSLHCEALTFSVSGRMKSSWPPWFYEFPF